MPLLRVLSAWTGTSRKKRDRDALLYQSLKCKFMLVRGMMLLSATAKEGDLMDPKKSKLHWELKGTYPFKLSYRSFEKKGS